jgi:arylsulfatase
MTGDDGLPGYRGDLNEHCVTIAEAMREARYATFMSGKWHVTPHKGVTKKNWPLQRGFDKFYGTILGAGSFYNPITLVEGNDPIEKVQQGYYFTDAITDNAVAYVEEHSTKRAAAPFFMYVAYTAPHWPLHALSEDIERYRGRFDAGWDVLREERLKRMKKLGVVPKDCVPSARDPRVPAWEDTPNQAWEARRMEVYAAQIDRMDQGIGRILKSLEETGQLDNTLLLFLADNGGCAEQLSTDGWGGFVQRELLSSVDTLSGDPILIGNRPGVMPGPESTFQSYGIPWANLSNTPFRQYKHFAHEGGIATPLIAHWPKGIAATGELRHQPGQLPDIMATCLDVARASYPPTFEGREITPLEGFSLVPTFENENSGRDALYFEHEGNRAIRVGRWKLVANGAQGAWALYDLETDRAETNDLAAQHPQRVKNLSDRWEQWARRCNVLPWPHDQR